MAKTTGVLKTQALIMAVEESAVLNKKLSETTSKYVLRQLNILKEERSYLYDFFGDILALLSRVNAKSEELDQAKYLIKNMAETQKRIIKIIEESSER